MHTPHRPRLRAVLLAACVIFAGIHSCESHGISELDEILDEPDAAVLSTNGKGSDAIVPESELGEEEEIVQGEEDFLMSEERGEDPPVMDDVPLSQEQAQGLPAAFTVVQAARVFHGRSNGRFDSQKAMQEVQLAMSTGTSADKQAKLDRLWTKWTTATPTLNLEVGKQMRPKAKRATKASLLLGARYSSGYASGGHGNGHAYGSGAYSSGGKPPGAGLPTPVVKLTPEYFQTVSRFSLNLPITEKYFAHQQKMIQIGIAKDLNVVVDNVKVSLKGPPVKAKLASVDDVVLDQMDDGVDDGVVLDEVGMTSKKAPTAMDKISMEAHNKKWAIKWKEAAQKKISKASQDKLDQVKAKKVADKKKAADKKAAAAKQAADHPLGVEFTITQTVRGDTPKDAQRKVNLKKAELNSSLSKVANGHGEIAGIKVPKQAAKAKTTTTKTTKPLRHSGAAHAKAMHWQQWLPYAVGLLSVSLAHAAW